MSGASRVSTTHHADNRSVTGLSPEGCTTSVSTLTCEMSIEVRKRRAEPTSDWASGIDAGFALAARVLGSGDDAEKAAERAHPRGPGPAGREKCRHILASLRPSLTPEGTRPLDARARAMLASEVGGHTGRRWLNAASTRPGFQPDAGVQLALREVAMRGGARPGGEDDPRASTTPADRERPAPARDLSR